MLKGINFKEVAVKAAGHTAGAVVAGKLNSVGFINKIANPMTQGLVKAAIGYIGVPLLAKKMKLTGKKGGLVESLGEGIGMVGILQAANSKFPTIVPKVSGVDGYEENPITGLGELFETEVSGYEENPAISNDADDHFIE